MTINEVKVVNQAISGDLNAFYYLFNCDFEW